MHLQVPAALNIRILEIVKNSNEKRSLHFKDLKRKMHSSGAKMSRGLKFPVHCLEKDMGVGELERGFTAVLLKIKLKIKVSC